MIKISNDDIRRNHELFIKASKAAGTALLESAYVTKTFPFLEAATNRTYPYEVKLPKTLPELLQGDFEPARVITVTEPVQGIYSNMWFGDATSRCTLRCGYVDGNSTKLCAQTIGAEDIHMILGGATGQGKSVTLNSIIFGMCMEFAPWEIDLTLCDAKIVEFKTYALQHPLPHIRRIAATEDADYIISVLETLNTEMNQWYSIFSLAGVKKIDDFRAKTGLCVPQHMIVVDEFQTLFKNAKKKMQRIIDLFDAFARLGRATGFHLILASQELGTDIPKNMLANIKIRAAMGCDASISEMILGNNEAKNNLGRRGKLIINSKIEGGKANNVTITVPFMPDDERIAIGKNIIGASDKLNYSTVLSFYDSEASIDEKDYLFYLSKFEQTNNRFMLGEPSYVKKGEQIVTLDFDGKEMENLLVLAPSLENQKRYFTMLKTNLQLLKGYQNLVISLNESLDEQCGVRDIVSNNMYSDQKSFDNDVLHTSFRLIARRKLCIAIDKMVFSSTDRDVDDDKFYKWVQKNSSLDTQLNRQRFKAGLHILNTDAELQKLFELDSVRSDMRVHQMENIVFGAVDTINMYGFADSMIDKRGMPPLFVWLLGMDKMIGLGRDSKNMNVQKFKKYLQDCTEYGVRFIIFTNTMEDVSDLKNGLRWIISDGAASKDINVLKLSDDFPDQVGKGLAVLSDLLAVEDKCIKFKKMRLDGEIFN